MAAGLPQRAPDLGAVLDLPPNRPHLRLPGGLSPLPSPQQGGGGGAGPAAVAAAAGAALPGAAGGRCDGASAGRAGHQPRCRPFYRAARLHPSPGSLLPWQPLHPGLPCPHTLPCPPMASPTGPLLPHSNSSLAGEPAAAAQQGAAVPSSPSGGAPTVVTEVAMQARFGNKPTCLLLCLQTPLVSCARRRRRATDNSCDLPCGVRAWLLDDYPPLRKCQPRPAPSWPRPMRRRSCRPPLMRRGANCLM